MGLTDDELKAQMMVEAEAAIDAVLAKRKRAEAITLSAIEALALRAANVSSKRAGGASQGEEAEVGDDSGSGGGVGLLSHNLRLAQFNRGGRQHDRLA
ncbi:MAG: hypothetical protein Kow00120_29820 [Anaerolineae bacterium]